MKIKEKDKKLIALLRKNSRESLTKLSKVTQIPISTIYTKLLGYKGDIIRKHTSLLDFNALGFHTQALLFFNCARSHLPGLQESLVKSSHINSVFKLSDGFMLMAEGIFKHISDVDEYLEELEARFDITSRKIFYIVNELRREGFLTYESFL